MRVDLMHLRTLLQAAVCFAVLMLLGQISVSARPIFTAHNFNRNTLKRNTRINVEFLKNAVLRYFLKNKNLSWKSVDTAANTRIKRRSDNEFRTSTPYPRTSHTHQIRIISVRWSSDEVSNEVMVSSDQINDGPNLHLDQRIIHRRHGEHAIRHLHHNRHTTERKKREQHKAKKVINLVKPQEVFECPTKDPARQHITIVRIDEICDGVPKCPNNEDEDPTACFFYKLLREQMAHMNRELKDRIVRRQIEL